MDAMETRLLTSLPGVSRLKTFATVIEELTVLQQSILYVVADAETEGKLKGIMEAVQHLERNQPPSYESPL